MPLTTFTANTLAQSAQVNANFALCVLTDTARTITASHTFSGSQTFTGGLVVTMGTQTTSTAGYAQTVTWNAALVSFNAFDISVTATASAIGSTPFRVRVDGSNVFAVSKANPGRWGTAMSGGPVTIAGGTISSVAETSLSLTATWNLADTFTAVKVNITDTSSDAASLLMDLQVASSSKFNVPKAGGLVTTGQIKTTLTTQQLALHYDGSNHLAVTVASNGLTTFNATGAGAAFAFSDAVTISSTLTVTGNAKFGGGAAANSQRLMVNEVSGTATGLQLFQDSQESWIMELPASQTYLVWTASTVEKMRLTNGGALTITGAMTTSAPTGGAGAWELGIANSVSPSSPNRTLTVEIGGTAYYIHAKTTND